MTSVAVSPSVLKWAVNRSGKGDLVHFYFPNWKKWITQERQPSIKQLERLSTFTATPLGFFFLEHPPVERLPIPHYRTINDKHTSPSPELLESIQAMERRQQWMREYLRSYGNEPLDFVGRL